MTWGKYHEYTRDACHKRETYRYNGESYVLQEGRSL